ncbi:hypothetical protein ACRRTK_019856 [Alexandromys fortis]
MEDTVVFHPVWDRAECPFCNGNSGAKFSVHCCAVTSKQRMKNHKTLVNSSCSVMQTNMNRRRL